MGRTKRVAFYVSPLKAKEGKDWALSCLWVAKKLLREDLRLLSALVTLVRHTQNRPSTTGGRRGGIVGHNELKEAGRTPTAQLPNVLRDGKKRHLRTTSQAERSSEGCG